jgi:hypothetical protein
MHLCACLRSRLFFESVSVGILQSSPWLAKHCSSLKFSSHALVSLRLMARHARGIVEGATRPARRCVPDPDFQELLRTFAPSAVAQVRDGACVRLSLVRVRLSLVCVRLSLVCVRLSLVCVRLSLVCASFAGVCAHKLDGWDLPQPCFSLLAHSAPQPVTAMDPLEELAQCRSLLAAALERTVTLQQQLEEAGEHHIVL